MADPPGVIIVLARPFPKSTVNVIGEPVRRTWRWPNDVPRITIKKHDYNLPRDGVEGRAGKGIHCKECSGFVVVVQVSFDKRKHKNYDDWSSGCWKKETSRQRKNDVLRVLMMWWVV